MNDFLYYNTPEDQFQTHYNNIQFPFQALEIKTQLPKNIAIIRAAVTIAFTGLIALKLGITVFCWPVVIAGIAFTGWTVYSHLYSKDPLIEAFYKISGGKDKFEKLPKIQLKHNSDGKISTAIRKLNWDNLVYKISKAKTLDGRNVVIIKGLSRNNEDSCQTKGILAFVEKIGPYDVERTISNSSEFVDSIVHAVIAPFQGNTFGRFLYSSKNTYCRIFSSISKDMANELFAQIETSSCR